MSAALPASDIPQVTPLEAVELERVELTRFIRAIDDLSPESWSEPVGRDAWDVHALVAHVAGSYAAQARLSEFVRQANPKVLRVYRAEGRSVGDTLARVQIGDRYRLTSGELVDELREIGPIAIERRYQVFRPLHVLDRALDGSVRLPGIPLGPFRAVRDLWYHRLEIADTVGGGFDLDSEHDRRIIALLVRSGAGAGNRALGERSADLVVDSVAGGIWRFGRAFGVATTITMDPIAFAKLRARKRSAAATRERSRIDGDVKIAMALLRALYDAR